MAISVAVPSKSWLLENHMTKGCLRLAYDRSRRYLPHPCSARINSRKKWVFAVGDISTYKLWSNLRVCLLCGLCSEHVGYRDQVSPTTELTRRVTWKSTPFSRTILLPFTLSPKVSDEVYVFSWILQSFGNLMLEKKDKIRTKIRLNNFGNQVLVLFAYFLDLSKEKDRWGGK